MSETQEISSNVGHGHVFIRPDKSRARCGGPRLCDKCQADLARLQAEAGEKAGADTGVRVVVTRTRKGYQWAQIARNGSAGAISPKTYDTKSNAVRAAKRQAALVGGVVEVL